MSKKLREFLRPLKTSSKFQTQNMEMQISEESWKMNECKHLSAPEWALHFYWSLYKTVTNCLMGQKVTRIVNQLFSSSRKKQSYTMVGPLQYSKSKWNPKEGIQRLCDLGVLKWQADYEPCQPYQYQKRTTLYNLSAIFGKSTNKMSEIILNTQNQNKSARARMLCICHIP